MNIQQALAFAENAVDGVSRDALEGIAKILAAEVRRLREENERLRNDAERLDWIGRQYLQDFCMMLVVDADHDGEYYVEGDDNQKGYGLTLRDAIDAARGAK